MSLLGPDLWNVLIGVAGAALGYWLRHRQGGVPAELAEAVRLLLDRQRQKQTEGQLAELLELSRKDHKE